MNESRITNETPDIPIPVVLDGLPNLALRLFIDVQTANPKKYLTTDDCRGRSIRFMANYHDDAVRGIPSTIPDANIDPWSQYITAINNGFGIFRCGSNYVGADIYFGWVTVNTAGHGGNLRIGIDGLNGRLFADSNSGGFGDRFQCELIIEVWPVASAADLVM